MLWEAKYLTFAELEVSCLSCDREAACSVRLLVVALHLDALLEELFVLEFIAEKSQLRMHTYRAAAVHSRKGIAVIPSWRGSLNDLVACHSPSVTSVAWRVAAASVLWFSEWTGRSNRAVGKEAGQGGKSSGELHDG